MPKYSRLKAHLSSANYARLLQKIIHVWSGRTILLTTPLTTCTGEGRKWWPADQTTMRLATIVLFDKVSAPHLQCRNVSWEQSPACCWQHLEWTNHLVFVFTPEWLFMKRRWSGISVVNYASAIVALKKLLFVGLTRKTTKWLSGLETQEQMYSHKSQKDIDQVVCWIGSNNHWRRVGPWWGHKVLDNDQGHAQVHGCHSNTFCSNF